MKKYCTSKPCVDAKATGRNRHTRDKVPKAVPDNTLECPDCGQQLQVFKMRRTRGKMTKDLDAMRF